MRVCVCVCASSNDCLTPEEAFPPRRVEETPLIKDKRGGELRQGNDINAFPPRPLTLTLTPTHFLHAPQRNKMWEISLETEDKGRLVMNQEFNLSLRAAVKPYHHF